MKKKVFVGRENELEQFHQTMKKLQAKHEQELPYANTILVYGVGGMGKTSLCNKFVEIIESEFPSTLHICIDWDLHKNRGSTLTPEELLDIVSREFVERFPKEMKPYIGAKKGIKKTQEKIERLLEQKRQALGTVSETAGTVTTDLTGNKTLGTVVKTGLGLIGKGVSAIDEKYLKEKAGVSDDDLFLYKDPVSMLARRLVDCAKTITAKKDKRIVLMMDTCELIVHAEEWFTDRFLIPLVDRNPNIVLIFSGRHNPYTLRTVVIDGHAMVIRGMADRMFHPPQCIDMQLFSRKDIEKYLKEVGYQNIDDKVIDFVQSFSRGVPFAVDLLTNALERIGKDKVIQDFGSPDFEKQLRQANSNEEVIWRVSHRFIIHCLDESSNHVDRNRIFSIALLDDMDSDILAEVWQVDNPSEVLEKLQAQYALFIGEGKLHDVVKDFLVDYLLENKTLRSDVAKPFAQKAFPLYEKKYREECEAVPVWEDRFIEDLWKKFIQRLMNAMVWVSPNDAIDFFIKRSIELFLFSPSLIRKLKEPLDKFLPLEEGIREKGKQKVNALMNALDSFSWYTSSKEEKEESVNVISFCNGALEEWELDPVHRAIIDIIKGRAEYNRENFEESLKTLLERVDNTQLDKSLKNKLAEALNDVGEKFCLDEKNQFLYSEIALKVFEKAVQLNSQRSSYLYHLGVMIDLGGNPQKALPFLLKSNELEPKDEYVLDALGKVYYDLNQYDKAIEMYQKAIEIDPKEPSFYNNLGYIFLNLGQYAEAIPYLLKSIELEPYIARYVNSGIAYYRMDEPGKGIEFFEKGLSLPDKTQDTKHQLNKVTAFLGTNQTDEALNLLKQNSEKQISKGYLTEFFSDCNLLASSPRPPQGVREFISKAKEMLKYEA